MKQVTLLFILLAITIAASSQVIGQPMGGGPTVSVMEVKTEKEKIDQATIRCYYKFAQPLKIEKENTRQVDTMTLDIGAKVSVYYDAMRMHRDSLYGAAMNSRLNPSMIKSLSIIKDESAASFDNSQGENIERNTKGETEKLYKYRQSGEVDVIDMVGGSLNLYKYTEKEIPEWNITADTLTVLGYLCQKATCDFRGRSYEAWFAPDVPVNDGPWKFRGLPGLIFKVSDSENLFTFEIIGLEQLATPADIILTKGEYMKTNRKELAKVKARKSGDMSININGGNVTMFQKENKNEYLPLEIE